MLMTIASEAKLKIAPERFFGEPNVHPRTERSYLGLPRWETHHKGKKSIGELL
jgi:hypothetical protein